MYSIHLTSPAGHCHVIGAVVMALFWTTNDVVNGLRANTTTTVTTTTFVYPTNITSCCCHCHCYRQACFTQFKRNGTTSSHHQPETHPEASLFFLSLPDYHRHCRRRALHIFTTTLHTSICLTKHINLLSYLVECVSTSIVCERRDACVADSYIFACDSCCC